LEVLAYDCAETGRVKVTVRQWLIGGVLLQSAFLTAADNCNCGGAAVQ